MPETLIFWGLSGMAILTSALVIGQRNPMYSVLMLIVSFAALAGLYITLDAPFVAMAQMIIYAGAIMVLFLFVVMLLNVPTEEMPTGQQAKFLGGAGPRRFGAILSAFLALQLFWAMRALNAQPMPGTDTPATTVAAIGERLFREYSFAFEATSVLILVAMVGAVILARKEHQ